MLALALLLLAAPSSGEPNLAQMTQRELVELLPDNAASETIASGPRAGEYLPVLAQLRARIERGEVLGYDSWQRILFDKHAVQWRKRWPVDHPFAVSVRLPSLQDGLEVQLVPRRASWTRALAATRSTPGVGCVGDRPFDERYQTLGWLEHEDTELVFDLLVDYAPRSAAAAATSGARRVGVVILAVEPVATIDVAVAPCQSASAMAQMRRAMELAESAVVIGPHSWPEHVARSFDVSLIHDGLVVQASELWCRSPGSRNELPLPGLARARARGETSLDRWSLRLRGTSKRVLHDWTATHYATDEIEIPLTELVARRR